MKLGFLNRVEELGRLESAFSKPEGSLVCIYGRRRCGKSRLLQQALKERRAVYYVGDERTGALQRRALARAMGALVPGFGSVEYPDWEVLLERWWAEAPPGAILALDEFPYLAAAAPALPSLLQKCVDRRGERGLHVALCGSSQRMMQGVALSASSPLYGRSDEILRIGPLDVQFIVPALRPGSGLAALEAWGIWGGVPRYWELAADCESHWEAVRRLVLDPMGVLHREPRRLLQDDIRETSQASSLLAVIGQGCRQLSDIARRLELPATSLPRPLERLLELGLVRRDIPFGLSERKTRQSQYVLADPFLAFWFRYVEPNRSRLAAGQVADVLREVRADYRNHLGRVWEDLARDSVARLQVAGTKWLPPRRWWGRGCDGEPLELDIVAESRDHAGLLVGEAKLTLTTRSLGRASHLLADKIARFPLASGRRVVPCLWYASALLPPGPTNAVHVETVLAPDP
jgi:AAA+ ATPase superfamily predicted ATPase